MFYSHFKKRVPGFDTSAPSRRVEIDQDLLRTLVIAALRQKTTVDEKYYLARYPDIAKAIAGGSIATASDHWYETGYFEGRQPRRILVDEEFYLQANPDVAKAVRAGKVESCQAHFDIAGCIEGRMPFAGFAFFES
jgi:hypothetical protein